MIHEFVYEAHAGRTTFATLTSSLLLGECQRLGIERALVLSTGVQEQEAHRISAMLATRSAGIFAGAVMHTPLDVTGAALAIVTELRADGVVAIGGGSTIGLAKAIALRTDLPQIVIPSTYAGSEMTPILGETKDGVKSTQTSSKIRPESVIYDVALTLGLPPSLSASSGINAIAHAVEALYARDRNPIIAMMAEAGVSALAKALPRIVQQPMDVDARSEAQYGAWLCGTCLGSVGMALHHKLCHALGGAFDLSHAETHSILLPHVLAYNAPFVPDAISRLGNALGTADPVTALFELNRSLGIKRGLCEIGMPESGIDHAAELAVRNPYWNPRPIEPVAIRALIARAWSGDAPVADIPRKSAA